MEGELVLDCLFIEGKLSKMGIGLVSVISNCCVFEEGGVV